MIDYWLYNKLTTTASITAIFSTRIYSDYKYNIESLPALVYYDVSETYEKNNILKRATKSLKIISKSKVTNIGAVVVLAQLFNSDIQAKYNTTVIYTTKTVGTVTIWDEANQSWITTIDIEIVYK